MQAPNIQFGYLVPEIILTATGILVAAVAAAERRGRAVRPPASFVIALLGSGAAFAAVFYQHTWLLFGSPAVTVAGALAVDGLSAFFKMLCILASVTAALLTQAYHRPIRNVGEFYSLLVFAELAMCLLVSATELITIYLALEFLSLVSYVMAGYLKEDARSNEASIKYFLYGAVSAGVMLYGMSILYGIGRTTDLGLLVNRIAEYPGVTPALVIATAMISVGFLFKIAAAPFHQWSPDIYEGAPTPVTAFLSVAPKAAGFGVLLRVFIQLFPTHSPDWVAVMAWLSALSMTVGNLSAIPQRNIKRMLAYSSIAQAGYVMMGVAVSTDATAGTGIPAAMLYLAVYIIMNLGAFAVAIAAERLTGSENIPDYAGLAKRAPWLAWTMVIFLISLAGLPLTAGFVAKYYLFAAVLRFHEFTWLAVVAAANTVVSVYYYLNVARWMFFAEPKSLEEVPQPFSLRLTLAGALVLTILIGVVPDPLVNISAASTGIYKQEANSQHALVQPYRANR
jgi:NADH-quinone oxidoreductase subunit N